MSRTGSIYKLCCNDLSIPEIYVGSTINFKHRKYKHKYSCTNSNDARHILYVYRYIREHGGFKEWSMIQLEEYKHDTKRQLESRERYWIETLRSSLNCKIPTRTHQEWIVDNREDISQKKKQIYENNKEAILQKKKQKYQNNKEVISQKKKEAMDCLCGAIVKIDSHTRHNRTQKHQF